MTERPNTAADRRDPRDRALDEPLDPDRPTALPDERSETGTDPDAGARPERDDILTREGADAPDAADIEDPDNQL